MDEYESDLAAFLSKKIVKLGGSAQLQYLVGVLSYLKPEIRSAIAKDRDGLLRFLRKHSNLFDVDANFNVKLKNSSSASFHDKEQNDNERFHSRSKADSLPSKITGEGIVSKINPTFGFISTKTPFKTVVYFTPFCFGDKSKTLFTDFEGLAPGKKICFIAKKGSDNHNSKYRATQVWYPKNVENEENSSPNPAAPNPRKTRETGLYDPVSLEGEGRIMKLFSTFGFIAIDNDKNNTVFFYKDQLANFQNVVDLTKTLQIGNLVSFVATRTVKKDIKARWSASQVWIIKSGKIHTTSNSSKSNSKDESLQQINKKRQILRDERGKIFPHPSGAIIKFGDKFEKLADADSSLFYMFGSKVKDVSWEFSDGDNVHFDAVEIKSHPGWKAFLVWSGDKPDVVLEADLGDFSDIACETDNFQEASSCMSKSSYYSARAEFSDKSQKNSKSKSLDDSSYVSNVNSKRLSNSNSSTERLHKDFETDDFSDSASYTSNISLNASTVERSKRHHKNRRNRRNSRGSYNGGNQVQNKKPNSSNVGKPMKEKGRFQRHLEFVSSDIKGSSVNIADDNKSVCSNASTEKLTFLRPPNHVNNIYKDWGDSPYPDDEEDMDVLDISHVSEDLIIHNNNEGKNDDSDKIEFPQCSSPVHSDISNGSSDLSKSSNNERYDTDVFNCEDFYETVERNESSGSLHDLLKDSDQTIEENDIPVKKASVKCFHEIEGIVKKVHCRYAEIESNKLTKPSSFFWSDYYPDGNPITDEFDDLREVIKVGEVLKFNCIEIIDNDGMCFIKPTVLWKGKKPTLVEITPEQFISQNNLSVSVSKESYENYHPNDNLPSVSTNSPEMAIVEPELPVKKFLTVANSHLENDAFEAEFETILSEEENTYDGTINIRHLNVDEMGRDNPELEFPLDRTELEFPLDRTELEFPLDRTELEFPLDRTEIISGISKIMKHKISSNSSLMDLNKISTEILNFVLNSTALHKSQSLSLDVLQKETQTETSEINSVIPESVQIENRNIEITHTESQTIFTGEVIGKSIFVQS